MPRRRGLRRALKVAAVVLAIAVAASGAFVGWNAWNTYRAWNSLPRVAFDPQASRTAIEQGVPPAIEPDVVAPGVEPAPAAPDLSDFDALFTTYLLVGRDDKAQVDSVRADAVLLVLLPDEGDPAIVSLPRDLLVLNPCGDVPTKLNRALEGCGELANGPELLALTVEDFTGVDVDHFGVVGFEGFVEVIDRLGGVQLCPEHPLGNNGREVIPAGCSLVTGEQALWYLRQRVRDELIDGAWQPVLDDDDLARAARQREVLLSLLKRLKRFRSFTSLASLVAEMSDAFVIDESLDTLEAARLAWDARRIDVVAVKQLVLPSEASVSPGGDFVRLPTATFEELLAGAYPDAARS